MTINKCPFCGSDNVYMSGQYWVHCVGCSTDGPESDSPEPAIESWNRVSDTVHGKPKGETVRRRIAYADHPNGSWSVVGWAAEGNDGPDDKALMGFAVEPLNEGERRLWVEFDVPVPQEPPVIEGKVVE